MPKFIYTDHNKQPDDYPPYLLELDESVFALLVIDPEHHQVHEGEMFTSSGVMSLSNGATAPLVLVSPAATTNPYKGALAHYHIKLGVSAQSRCNIAVYEAVTYDSVSTPATIVNRNRNYGVTENGLAIYTAAANFAAGTTLVQTYDVQAGRNIGATARADVEIILKPSTKYAFVITNLETSTNRLTWELDWYVH